MTSAHTDADLSTARFTNPAFPVPERVVDLLQRMTVEEKVGQTDWDNVGRMVWEQKVCEDDSPWRFAHAGHPVSVSPVVNDRNAEGYCWPSGRCRDRAFHRPGTGSSRC